MERAWQDHTNLDTGADEPIERLQRLLKANLEARARSEEEKKAMEVDHRIAVLTAEIRKMEAANGSTEKQKAELDSAQAQLKEQLSNQFDRRQKDETEELKKLRQRLDKLEKEISDRAQNRDSLIKRRFDELNSPSSDGTTASVIILDYSNCLLPIDDCLYKIV